MKIGNIGIAGEVRCVVTKADGKIKVDTGYQKNLILDTFLEYLGSGSTNQSQGFELYSSCAIGSGNSVPSPKQTALDSFEYVVNFENDSKKIKKNYDYREDNNGYYTVSQETQYVFKIGKSVNISEVGLVSNKDASISSYNLITRTLIKDSLGSPTTISLSSGEILTVFYKLYKAVSLADVTHKINLLDGNGGSIEYDVVIRPAEVGKSGWGSFKTIQFTTGSGLSTQDLGAVDSKPLSLDSKDVYFNHYSYEGGLKKKCTMSLSISQYNKSLRSLFVENSLGIFQIRYGSTVGDKPIPKTDKDRLSLPIEFSWGRYEGEL